MDQTKPFAKQRQSEQNAQAEEAEKTQIRVDPKDVAMIGHLLVHEGDFLKRHGKVQEGARKMVAGQILVEYVRETMRRATAENPVIMKPSPEDLNRVKA